jgi:hypothetical protein
MEFYKYENTIKILEKYFEGGNAKGANPVETKATMENIIETVSSLTKEGR